MTGSEFRALLPDRVRHHLPEEWRGFQHRARFLLVQFWYDDPAFHFEVWPQKRYGVLEVGLHLEHTDPRRNTAIHSYLDRHLIEIHHELGELWLERWDKGWHKLYTTRPLTTYNPPFLEAVSQQLARQMTVLQPLLMDALRQG